MSLLFESIQILDGIPQRLDYHNDRLNRSRNQLMCSHADIYIEDHLHIPQDFKKGHVKCRLNYGQDIDEVEFVKYQEKRFLNFKLTAINFSYDFKYDDRSVFEKLKETAPNTTEFILIKNGIITDTTFSNIVFKNKDGQWLTPNHPLLEGTQREFLLDEGVIEEAEISVADLKHYTHFMLINAMLTFDTKRVYDVGMLQKQ